MLNNSIFKYILFLTTIFLFVSCDKEYNAVGDTLIGNNHFDLGKYTSSVLAYNEKVTPVESNNLPINALGIYNNSAFGKTTASFVTQLTLASLDPVIGANPVIDSVYIDVPYFKTLLSTDTSGNNVYELDSIYGKLDAKIKLSIYESGRYMGSQNGVSQKFYTDQNAEFNTFKIGNRLNDDVNTAQNDAFFFNPKENKYSTTDATTAVVTTVRSAPSMRLKLNTTFFKNKIINAPSGSLATNDVFINYFKGLYFKVEQSGSDAGSLAMMNFADGKVTIKYKEDTSLTDATRVNKSIVLNMSGTTASLLDQSNTNIDYSNAISNSNPTTGDEKLYLKGGEGSLSVIKLFGPDLYGVDGKTGSPNGVADELDIIRKNGWLINEANLVFNIDATTMTNSYEPDRIYLYDFTNSRFIIDYYLDNTSAVWPKMSRLIFDGNINRDATTKRGSTYKFRITNHVRNLVKYADSTNVKLGIAVSESINTTTSNKLKTPTNTPLRFISQAPKASVMNPLGTILYGGKSSVPVDKRLQLEIYYTKPN